jgi:hypothetical protein
VDSFRCATCGNPLSGPLRRVDLPAGPHWSLLSHHQVNPPLLDPGTYAVDQAPYGRDQEAGTFVLSPGDVHGTRFVHELVLVGCWSLIGWAPCVACDECGALVAARSDDCGAAQETRLYPSSVVRETDEDEVDRLPDPFTLIAGWDDAPPDTRERGSAPRPTRARPELTATRWGGRDVKADLYRDDPPA